MNQQKTKFTKLSEKDVYVHQLCMRCQRYILNIIASLSNDEDLRRIQIQEAKNLIHTWCDAACWLSETECDKQFKRIDGVKDIIEYMDWD